MIGRSRGAKSPLGNAQAFCRHLLKTGVADLEDELWEPVADTTVAHFEVLCLDEVGLG